MAVWFKLNGTWRSKMEIRPNIQDAMLQRIRFERHIRPPVLRCPRCGHVGEGAEPRVSVRAMILSLLRFGIADAQHVNFWLCPWPPGGNAGCAVGADVATMAGYVGNFGKYAATGVGMLVARALR